MNKFEKDVLLSVCREIDASDDKIDLLERLHREVKRLLNYK